MITALIQGIEYSEIKNYKMFTYGLAWVKYSPDSKVPIIFFMAAIEGIELTIEEALQINVDAS